MVETEVRELVTRDEWVDAFPLIEQLRPRLNEAQYLGYLEEMTTSGYRLFGLFSEAELVAVAGVDLAVNMYHGRHLWVHELVTDAARRSSGFGRQLVRYLVEWATHRGCETVALSSGVQREDAHRFYEERVGMDRASHVFTLEVDDPQEG